MSAAAYVRRVRAVLRITQGELGTLLGCDKSTVSRWERELQEPADTHRAWLEILERFAEVAESDGQPLLRYAQKYSLPAAWHLALNYAMPGRNRMIEAEEPH